MLVECLAHGIALGGNAARGIGRVILPDLGVYRRYELAKVEDHAAWLNDHRAWRQNPATTPVSQDELTKSDVVNLMSQFRICLEAEGFKKRYPYLTMYCDWTVHSQLSRSAPAFQVIESIADAMVGNPNAPNSPAFYDDITKAFLFDEFRADCNKFAAQFGTPNVFCADPEVWSGFLVLLIEILLERPLEFPDPSVLRGGVSSIFNRIQRKWTPAFQHTLGIKKVSFVPGTVNMKARCFGR